MLFKFQYRKTNHQPFKYTKQTRSENSKCALYMILFHYCIYILFLWQKRKLHLSLEQCCDFYADQYGKPVFPSLTAFMSSGPTMALTLARKNAVAHWKSIIGPVNSMKARETHPEWSVCEFFDQVL